MKVNEVLHNNMNDDKYLIAQVSDFVDNIELDMEDFEDIKSTETSVPYGDTFVDISDYDEDDVFKVKKQKAYNMLEKDTLASTFDYINNIDNYYPDDESDESFQKIKRTVLEIIEKL